MQINVDVSKKKAAAVKSSCTLKIIKMIVNMYASEKERDEREI